MSTAWGSKSRGERGSQDLMRRSWAWSLRPVSDHEPGACSGPSCGMLRGPGGPQEVLPGRAPLGHKLQPEPDIPDAEVRGGTISHGGQSKGWRGLLQSLRQDQLLQVSGHWTGREKSSSCCQGLYHFVQHGGIVPLQTMGFCSSEQRCLGCSLWG